MVEPLSFDPVHIETQTSNPTNLESVWWLKARSHDFHPGHIVSMSTESADEQDRTGTRDIPKEDQIQISVYVEAGVRNLKAHVFISGAVIKLD